MGGYGTASITIYVPLHSDFMEENSLHMVFPDLISRELCMKILQDMYSWQLWMTL